MFVFFQNKDFSMHIRINCLFSNGCKYSNYVNTYVRMYFSYVIEYMLIAAEGFNISLVNA